MSKAFALQCKLAALRHIPRTTMVIDNSIVRRYLILSVLASTLLP